MDAKEKQLDELVKMVESHKIPKHPPLFEIYVTMFSILTSILLFWFMDLFLSGANLYSLLLKIMPQYLWALGFFTAGMLKAVGLLIKNDPMRILGLVMSSILYLMFCISYSIIFPNVGAVMFFCMTVFTIISIPVVKHTGLDR